MPTCGHREKQGEAEGGWPLVGVMGCSWWEVPVSSGHWPWTLWGFVLCSDSSPTGELQLSGTELGQRWGRGAEYGARTETKPWTEFFLERNLISSLKGICGKSDLPQHSAHCPASVGQEPDDSLKKWMNWPVRLHPTLPSLPLFFVSTAEF